MREILFRGKSIKTGEWVSGMNIFFACNPERTLFAALITPSGTHIDHSVVDDNKMQHVYDSVEVDVETVGQFTGHVDKNGKKIFEGDIIDMCDEWWDADNHFVLCGGRWVFCDENCAYCVNNLITTTNATITTSEYKIDSCGNVRRADNG